MAGGRNFIKSAVFIMRANILRKRILILRYESIIRKLKNIFAAVIMTALFYKKKNKHTNAHLLSPSNTIMEPRATFLAKARIQTVLVIP